MTDKVESKVKTNSSLDLKAVYDIPLKLSVVLGSTELKVSSLLELSKGAVIELDKKVGEPVDLLINDKIVAHGEIILIDNKVGVTITELVAND